MWRGEQIFQDVHRQITAPSPTLYGAPVPHPGQTRSLFEERLSHGMSALSKTTRANRPVSARVDGSTPSNSHTIPNQGYQANAAAILACLRAQGVEINNTPRHFDFARDLARLRAVNQPSAHIDAPLVSQTPSQRTDTVPSAGSISGENIVWNTAVSSEPDSDSTSDLGSRSGV